MGIALLAASSVRAPAECVTVKYRETPVCLDTFKCVETRQSSFVRADGFDERKSYLVVKSMTCGTTIARSPRVVREPDDGELCWLLLQSEFPQLGRGFRAFRLPSPSRPGLSVSDPAKQSILPGRRRSPGRPSSGHSVPNADQRDAETAKGLLDEARWIASSTAKLPTLLGRGG